MKREIDERAEPLIYAASRNVFRRFHHWVSFEDMHQEGYLWCLEHPKKLKEYLEDGKIGERKLATSLKRHCEKVARRSKAAREGYEISDEVFYQIAQLSELLPVMFDRENWAEQPNDFGEDRVSGTREPAEGGNWLATMVDVSTAYEHLTIQDRRLLRRHYKDEWTFDRIADAEQINYHQARRAVGDALIHLLDELGGPSPWTGKDYK